MSDPAAYYSNLRRGQLLRESQRYEEACTFLGKAIEADPEEADAYLELALAQSALPARKSEALRTMDRAVALEPHSSYFLGYKAYLLAQLGQSREAIKVADSALEIDPECHVALMAQANACIKLQQWALVEDTSRRLLAINGEDTQALNLLAQALRYRSRIQEAREVTSRILERVPNDAFAQANAGWEALRSNDHLRANTHFLNALRVDPHCDYARAGLLQSLRCRIWIYRINLKIVSLLAATGNNFGRIFALGVFCTGGLLLGPGLLYAAIALTLQPLSNFFLLFDPRGYQAFKPKERRWALFTGGMASLLLLTLAYTELTALFIMLGCYLFLFAFFVYLPQWTDAWRAKREERLLLGENPL